MKYPPYPAYKSSGVEWLGEVPEHWEILAVRRIAHSIKTGSTPPTSEGRFYEDGTVPWYGPSSFDHHILLGTPEKFLNSTTFVEGKARLYPKGATMIVTIGATLGKVSSLSERGSCNQQITVIEFDQQKVFSRFGTYQLKRLESDLRAIAPRATLPILSQGEIASVDFCFPPLPEQQSIANFLDRETAKLDSLIGKQQELIEKLKVKRTVLISRTVTRGLLPDAAAQAGLNPNPKLKASGVEWLGEVPEHWEVQKFSHILFIAEGQVDPEEEPFVDMLLIAPNHVESYTGRLLARETARAQGAQSGKYFCCQGDVIYSKIRPALRKVTIAPEDCLCSADMYPINGTSKANNRYICWLLLSESFSAWSVVESDRVAMPKINRETLSALRLPLPSISEQHAIANFLDRETEKIDRLIERVQEAIAKLQIYRTSLITAAVTGKIDVREGTT